MDPPRQPFTDGIFSIWHLLLGYFAVPEPIIMPFFIIYQMMEAKNKENTMVDISEFIVGMTLGLNKIRLF